MTALSRRGLFESAAATLLPPPCPAAHLDHELLNVCAELGRQRDEWQRLYHHTSNGPALAMPGDHAWNHYDQEVWPWRTGGLLTRLLQLPARTPEELAAKAAAVCAQDDAASYSGDCHDDACALWASVARGATGAAYRPLGEEGETRR